MTDSELRKHLLLCPISSPLTSVHLYIKHFPTLSLREIHQEIEISFPGDYPNQAPTISLLPNAQIAVSIPEIITKCSLTEPQNWNPNTRLKDIIGSIIKSLSLFWETTFNFGRNIKFSLGGNPAASGNQDQQKVLSA